MPIMSATTSPRLMLRPGTMAWKSSVNPAKSNKYNIIFEYFKVIYHALQLRKAHSKNSKVWTTLSTARPLSAESETGHGHQLFFQFRKASSAGSAIDTMAEIAGPGSSKTTLVMIRASQAARRCCAISPALSNCLWPNVVTSTVNSGYGFGRSHYPPVMIHQVGYTMMSDFRDSCRSPALVCHPGYIIEQRLFNRFRITWLQRIIMEDVEPGCELLKR
jgi:hypothetical protein